MLTTKKFLRCDSKNLGGVFAGLALPFYAKPI